MKTTALAALTGLVLPLVSTVAAQGYFGGDEYDVCGDDYQFRYIGCYDGELINDAGSTFVLNIGTYIPSDPQLNYANPFPGYVPNTNYNSTVAPYSCAQACRGYGYGYSAMASNECYCSPLPPASDATASNTCTEPCWGDASQTCGGARTGADTVGAAQVYGDPSFASPVFVGSNMAPGSLDSYYQYLGCYYQPNFGPGAAQGNGVIKSCQASYTECYTHCSAYGYPLAAVGYSPSGTQMAQCSLEEPVSCLCGTSFGEGSYRVDDTKAPYESLCAVDCATGLACDSTTQTCCGSNDYYPVYINPELTGCYQPQIPGYGVLSGSTLTDYTCAAPPDSDLIGGPKVLPNGVEYFEGNDYINTVVANHPVFVVSPEDAPYDNYYIIGCCSDCSTGEVFSSTGSIRASYGAENGLHVCAQQCAPLGYPYFAVGGGGVDCYCGTTLSSAATPRDMADKTAAVLPDPNPE
ncbi:hypothetical protein Sste5344_009295 [Sporothrix stenoceras]